MESQPQRDKLGTKFFKLFLCCRRKGISARKRSPLSRYAQSRRRKLATVGVGIDCGRARLHPSRGGDKARLGRSLALPRASPYPLKINFP